MAKVRLAIVGLNHYHAAGWAGTLRNLEDEAAVVAIYDSDPARRETLRPPFQDPHLPQALDPVYRSVPFYSDLDVLLRQARPEAALVMDHHRDNPGHVARLAAAGVHVFVDKSGGRNAAEMARAVEAVRKAGVVMGAGLTWRLKPEVAAARRMVRDGEVGSLMGAEAIMVSSTVRARNPNNFIFSKELSGGGFVHWLHIHFLDGLRYITGQRIVSVQGMAANIGGQSIDVEDVGAAALEFENGAIGTLFGGYILPRWVTEGRLAVHGSERSLVIGLNGLTVLSANQDRQPMGLPPVTAPAPRHAGYGGATGVKMLRDWLAACQGRGNHLSSYGEDLVQVLAVIDAIYASAASGRRERVARYD